MDRVFFLGRYLCAFGGFDYPCIRELLCSFN